jgi:hypothetical protein
MEAFLYFCEEQNLVFASVASLFRCNTLLVDHDCDSAILTDGDSAVVMQAREGEPFRCLLACGIDGRYSMADLRSAIDDVAGVVPDLLQLPFFVSCTSQGDEMQVISKNVLQEASLILAAPPGWLHITNASPLQQNVERGERVMNTSLQGLNTGKFHEAATTAFGALGEGFTTRNMQPGCKVRGLTCYRSSKVRKACTSVVWFKEAARGRE